MNTHTPTTAPRFDSNRAWQDTSSTISANRDMLIALAGVFIVLPAFAIAALNPPPEPVTGADLKAVLEQLGTYFQQAWPGYLLVALINTIGTMAILALFGHASRPTVGQAIRQGLITTPIAIVVQLIQGFALTAALLIPARLLGLAGSPGLTALGILIGIGFAVYLLLRFGLASVVIAVEGQRNPIAALQRSFALTKANAGRLLVFFVLLALAFAISMQLLQLLIGVVVQLLAGGEAATMILALTGAILSAVMSVYLLGAAAMSHRQLSSGSAAQASAAFE